MRTRQAIARVAHGHAQFELGRGVVAELPVGADQYTHRIGLVLARAVAASRRTSVRHALSVDTAAACHGLKLWRPLMSATLTAEVKASSSWTNGYRRRTAPLPERDVIEIGAVPCTSLARTVVDCARFLPPLDGLVVADQAIRQMAGVRDKRRWETYLDAIDAARQSLVERVLELPLGSSGRRRALAVLRWASPWAESPPETFLRWAVLRWGRRDVEAQVDLSVGQNRYFSDVAVPDGLRPDGTQRWVHGEWDGYSKYRAGEGDVSARVLIDELARQRNIESLGDSVVRFDRTVLGRPQAVAGALSAHLREGVGRLRPVPELR